MAAIDHVSKLFEADVPTGVFLALDTNILIQICDETNEAHAQTQDFFKKLKGTKSPRLIYFLASKLELTETFRRRFLTLYLRDRYRKGSDPVGGNGVFDAYCKAHPKLIPNADDDDLLTDREIKDLRKRCFQDFPSVTEGMKSWETLAGHALRARFRKMAQTLDSFGVRYQNLFDPNLFSEGEGPRWQDQEALIINYGLSSSDAAILNMANSSSMIYGILSNDFDILEIFKAAGPVKTVRCFSFLTSN